MKLEDHIKQSIHTYPTLYKDVDYARSRIKVLGHMFLTLGNGIEFAETTYLDQGGYLVSHRDDVPNLPYGERKYTGPELDEAYFASSITEPMFNEERKKDLEFFAKTPGILEIIRHKVLVLESKKAYNPYPLCDIANIHVIAHKGIFMQPDWLSGGIDICKVALAYYKDPERYKEGSYYPSAKDIYSRARDLLTLLKDHGPLEYEKLRAQFDYSPDQTVIYNRTKDWVEFHEKVVQDYREILELLGVKVPTKDLAKPIDFETLFRSVQASFPTSVHENRGEPANPAVIKFAMGDIPADQAVKEL